MISNNTHLPHPGGGIQWIEARVLNPSAILQELLERDFVFRSKAATIARTRSGRTLLLLRQEDGSWTFQLDQSANPGTGFATQFILPALQADGVTEVELRATAMVDGEQAISFIGSQSIGEVTSLLNQLHERALEERGRKLVDRLDVSGFEGSWLELATALRQRGFSVDHFHAVEVNGEVTHWDVFTKEVELPGVGKVEVVTEVTTDSHRWEGSVPAQPADYQKVVADQHYATVIQVDG